MILPKTMLNAGTIICYKSDLKATLNARVFISSGQRDVEERRITEELKNRLIGLGYEPYVAIQEQSTKPLIKNILNILKDSEYFLFIDFRLINHRIQRLIVYQSRISPSNLSRERDYRISGGRSKKLDGMLGAIQGNVESFSDSDRNSLVSRIIWKVESKWIPYWRLVSNRIWHYSSCDNYIAMFSVSTLTLINI